MATINGIAADPQRESDGVWVRFPGTDLQLRIARSGRMAFLRHVRRLLTAHGGAGEEELDERQMRDVIAPAVAAHLLRDWRNLQDDQGHAVGYSVPRAQELLQRHDLDELYTFVLDVAGRAEHYRRAAQERDAWG
jgi:hypothetical protein